jgi:hypothetical protein
MLKQYYPEITFSSYKYNFFNTCDCATLPTFALCKLNKRNAAL